MVEYILTLNSEQAREIAKAVELLMRLKLKQSFSFSDAVAGWEYFGEQRYREATRYVEYALDLLFEGKDEHTWKDAEWYRLYNAYQVIRHAIHEAEHPDFPGVDAYPPIKITDEPLPKIEWRKKDESEVR